MKLKVESESWFVKPEMMGHVSAKEQVIKVKELASKYAKRNLQKEVLTWSVDLDSTDWHVWHFLLTNKYIDQIRYVLRRVGKAEWLSLLWHHYATSGCLKDSLTRYLELQSYRMQPADYFDSYKVVYMGLGMTEDDCRQRFTEYHEKLANKMEFDLTSGKNACKLITL